MTLTPTGAPPAAPPRRVPVWLSLSALALGGFGIGTTEFATMGVLPSVTADLGTSVPAGGHLVSSYALGVVVGAPLLAVVGARLPRKALLLALAAAFTLGNALSALAPTFGTLTLARFATGLPHGAYFGTAAIVAASLVPPERRGRAVARVMLGLTVANVVGVPLATLLGQQWGWRSTYWAVAVMGLLTVAALVPCVPSLAAPAGASPRRELGALRDPVVLLALLVGAIGFGGFFAVYSYITPTLTTLTGLPLAAVPVALALFGLGMTVGTEAGGRLADRSVVGAVVTGFVATTAVLLAFTVTVHSVVPAAVTVFLIGASGSLALPALTARLLDVAGDAQAVAAAGNHSALNVANALGAFLGGAVITAGLGYTAPAFVGAALAAGGLATLWLSLQVERRRRPADVVQGAPGRIRTCASTSGG